MKLYERVRLVPNLVDQSQTAVGHALGLSQSKFNGYLNEKSEKNLWPLLDLLLQKYPQISREWLYFGEGPQLAAEVPELSRNDLEELAAVKAELAAVKAKYTALLEETQEAFKQIALSRAGVRFYPPTDPENDKDVAREDDFDYSNAQENLAPYGSDEKGPTG